MTADLVGPTPKPPANTPGVHSIEGCLQVGLRGGHVRIELAYVPEGVRVHKADSSNRGAESGGPTVDEQVKQERRENSALRDACVNQRLGG